MAGTSDARFRVVKPGDIVQLPLRATLLLFVGDAAAVMSAEVSSRTATAMHLTHIAALLHLTII